MTGFVLHLQDATHHQRIDGVRSFVGEDASGSFGILPGHERMMTALVFGLARFRAETGPWQYLAMPGGLLYFFEDQLCISTRRYLVDADYDRITASLEEQLLAEEESLHEIKQRLHNMEEQMLKRLWKMSRSREAAQ